MSKIFLTSDLHFGHDREFVWKVRGFNSVDEMNETIVEIWNATVADEDHVYVLGDLMLGSVENINWIKKLKGNIHIVLGNHDTANREKMYRELENVVEVESAIRLNYKKYHFFLTHFPCMTGNLERESLKQMTCNLYGHTHQKGNFYEDRPYMYHVGVDSHGCCPVFIDDIIAEMNAKVRECVDFLTDEVDEYNEKYEAMQEIAVRAGTPDQSRCDHCVFTPLTCGSYDRDRQCPKYKREATDGGFYG